MHLHTFMHGAGYAHLTIYPSVLFSLGTDWLCVEETVLTGLSGPKVNSCHNHYWFFWIIPNILLQLTCSFVNINKDIIRITVLMNLIF